jgi:superfamily II DNA or RNA helicase
MPMTDFHSKYCAHAVLRRSPSSSVDKLSRSILDATVDLNPHQIDAALFAFRSPLSRGAILADEVGLGKTIEAGLVISQLWAERKRKILIITPPTLCKQWSQELIDKFFLPSKIIDSRAATAYRKSGISNPLNANGSITICSYHFARAQEQSVRATAWDLVVIDEAHRLRNVIKSGNKIAKAIQAATHGTPKLLLTATPLQNSLLELYGLVSFLDEHIFGDLASFRGQYLRGALNGRQFEDLKRRLRPICQRTLRRQVTEYVRYTNRISVTQDFTPTDEEDRLYREVSDYLQRDELLALPASQRKLMTLVLRKLLASSSFAIAGTLASLVERLRKMRGEIKTAEEPSLTDFEVFDELREEWEEIDTNHEPESQDETVRAVNQIDSEIGDLNSFHNLATSITTNAKGHALLKALELGFQKLQTLGANRKAIIFTESRRTQDYLFTLLESSGYADQVMLFNGTNADARSGETYEAWRIRHEGEDIVTNSKNIDLRAALVEHFREHASIMIATEAAAEGVNLQFCSLVINYDLPWNPQRIEQRIGRCHRYGQRYDVVVINFLNRRNEADQRVFQLLSEKFKLFDGVFGASDEVLGALESGVDFEKRIGEIYQNCRTPVEIDSAFNELQSELEDQITARLSETRASLLENFDEEVHERLRVHHRDAAARLDRWSRWLWTTTQHELTSDAVFEEEDHIFTLTSVPLGCQPVPLGKYQVVARNGAKEGCHAYRSSHALAEFILKRAANRNLAPSGVYFSYSDYPGKISLLERLVGKAGWLVLKRLSVTALETEERLLFAAQDDSGEGLDQETCERLFDVAGSLTQASAPPSNVSQELEARLEAARAGVLSEIGERNGRFFEDEIEKLERWAEDLKEGLESELKELDADIKNLKRQAKIESDLETKLALHRKAKDLESDRSQKRRALYEAQDDIERRKEMLIAEVEARLKQSLEEEVLFTIRWQVL